MINPLYASGRATRAPSASKLRSIAAGIRPRVLIAAALIGVAGCSSVPAIDARQDYNPAIDFSTYQTWSFISDRPMVVASTSRPVNPIIEQRLAKAIRTNLEGKGFTYVDDPEQADAVISFTIGSREQIDVNQYPVSYQGSYGRFFNPYGTMVYGQETVVREYTEGQLAIDVFDVATRTPAFHGSATTRLNENSRDNAEEIAAAVIGEALDGFPPGRDGSNASPDLVPIAE